jgi:AAA domain
MAFQFKKAIREQVGLIVGVAGGTGSGKTFSALRIAAGISGDKPFAVIDTEAGRSKHYADMFNFEHGDLHAPFSPDAYKEAILAADAAGYPCIVVDSMTHEWAGEGGVLEMQEEELDRMAGDNWQKREACKMAAWIKPKMAHKKMVQRLLQVRAHLILCFRAEEKVDMVRDDKGKMQIVPKVTRTGLDGWVPVCEKNLPYELTTSFLLTSDAPGLPKPIKLQEQHRIMFPLDKPIAEESGRLITQWAHGYAPKTGVAAAMAEDEVAALLKPITDAKTLSELTPAYEAACKRANKARDKSAKDRFIAAYNKIKTIIESEQI